MENSQRSSQQRLLTRIPPEADPAARQFSPLISAEFAQALDWNNPDDPLLRQVLPSVEELTSPPGYRLDPLEEHEAQVAPGALRKYQDRLLLTVTAACPIHCRFCFRRHNSMADLPRTAAAWQPALEWLAANPEIREVILSGGDPFMLDSPSLAAITTPLNAIPHVERLRIHTRVPTTRPDRIDDKLLDWLTSIRPTVVLVLHINHPLELGAAAQHALCQLQEAGLLLLSQTVLLRGVNDHLETLRTLCATLLRHKVLPYYLHLLDPVAGAAHFAVSAEEGARLLQSLRATLPGYAIPRLVREVPGMPNKVVVAA